MIRLSIPDMSCGHCRASVTAALRPLPGVAGLQLDADTRTAAVDGAPDPGTLIAALGKIGFPASLAP